VTIKEAIQKLRNKENLNKDEAYEVFKKIATEDFDEKEVEEFLI